MQAVSQRKLRGFKQKIAVKRIEDGGTDGVAYLTDLRFIENEEGLDGTFSFALQNLDFEMWFNFAFETTLCLALSLTAVILVILVITSNCFITSFVFMCVALTDIFLFGHIHYMGLTLNPLTVLNIIIAMGIAVDYSAHIAYAYLVEQVPEELGLDTPQKVRNYKATMALRKMGSSVFHGGFSTFIAVFALVSNETYVGMVFFRLWVGIIFFGMANGFLLLPVMLSFIGPLDSPQDPLAEQDGKANVGSSKV